MKKEKYLPILDPSKITVDYKNNSIRITPPKKPKGKRKEDVLGFISLWGIIFMTGFLILILISSFCADILNQKYSPLQIDVLGDVILPVYSNSLIFLPLLKYLAISSLLFTFGVMWLTKKRTKGKIKSSKPQFSLRISGKQKSNIIITPAFDNVCLFYKAKGDYGKYLTKIKVREIPLKKIGLKGKEEDYKGVWQGIFIFTKPPQKGCLELQYK